VVNNDAVVDGRLKVAFVPDYRVTLAGLVIPAADLSEQISTAGMEASGTGNMKMALNGALTIGTLDGANVEIRDAVGEDNIFIFGLDAAQVAQLRTSGHHHTQELVAADPELGAVVEAIRDGLFVDGDRTLLADVWSALMERGDRFMHLADFRSYVDAQERVSETFRNRRRWAGMAIRNVAHMGKFSSDRAIHEYARLIWDLQPVQPNGHGR